MEEQLMKRKRNSMSVKSIYLRGADTGDIDPDNYRKIHCLHCGLPIAQTMNDLLYVVDNSGHQTGKRGAVLVICKRCGQHYHLVIILA